LLLFFSHCVNRVSEAGDVDKWSHAILPELWLCMQVKAPAGQSYTQEDIQCHVHYALYPNSNRDQLGDKRQRTADEDWLSKPASHTSINWDQLDGKCFAVESDTVKHLPIHEQRIADKDWEQQMGFAGRQAPAHAVEEHLIAAVTATVANDIWKVITASILLMRDWVIRASCNPHQFCMLAARWEGGLAHTSARQLVSGMGIPQRHEIMTPGGSIMVHAWKGSILVSHFLGMMSWRLLGVTLSP